MATTTAAYAVSVPMVMARPDTRPPSAKPTLRRAPRKPNHSSRSPGREMTATVAPKDPQNAVRPTLTSTVASRTPPKLSTTRYAAKPRPCSTFATWSTRCAPTRSTMPPTTGPAGIAAAEAIERAAPTCDQGERGRDQEVEHRDGHEHPAADGVHGDRGDEAAVLAHAREPQPLQHAHIVQRRPLPAASGYRTRPSGVASLGRMTFSIVARSDDGDSWGVAVTSKFLAVGSAVPAAVAGVGAIATQADANVAYKGLALAHLDTGATASEVVQASDRAGRGPRPPAGRGRRRRRRGRDVHRSPVPGLGRRPDRRRLRDPGQHPGRPRGGRGGRGALAGPPRRAVRPAAGRGAAGRRRRRRGPARASVGRGAGGPGGRRVRRPRRHRGRPARTTTTTRTRAASCPGCWTSTTSTSPRPPTTRRSPSTRSSARSSRTSPRPAGTATSTPGSAPRTTRCGWTPDLAWIDRRILAIVREESTR